MLLPTLKRFIDGYGPLRIICSANCTSFWSQNDFLANVSSLHESYPVCSVHHICDSGNGTIFGLRCRQLRKFSAKNLGYLPDVLRLVGRLEGCLRYDFRFRLWLAHTFG